MAGFVGRPKPADEESADLVAIEAATVLTAAHRLAMREIYRGFLDANIVRHARTE